jgi:hypothetical protein
MRIVGGANLLLGLGFIPFVNTQRLGLIFPPLEAGPDTIVYRALIDWMFLFGLDLTVVGAALLYWSRDPARAQPLVGLAIALELVHGTGFDLYYATRGYVSVPFYLGFAAVHLIAVMSGVVLLRRGREASVTRAAVHA